MTLKNSLPSKDDPDRYEDGELTDDSQNIFPITKNGLDTVTVKKVDVDGDGAKEKPVAGIATLQDDDAWQDNDDVPMPLLGEVQDAMKRAYVQYKPNDADFEAGDNNDSVSFDLNTVTNEYKSGSAQNSELAATFDWDSQSSNSDDYWVGYILGAFQPVYNHDGDPNSESNKLLGYRIVGEGVATFVEVARDYGAHDGFTETTGRKNAVVHELGHQVGTYDSHPVTKFDVSEANPILYTDDYLHLIRNSSSPN